MGKTFSWCNRIIVRMDAEKQTLRPPRKQRSRDVISETGVIQNNITQTYSVSIRLIPEFVIN